MSATTSGLDLLGALTIEDGRSWAEAAVGFQWADAEAVLDPERPPFAFLTRPRGGSKTSDLAGFLVSAMLSGLIPAHGRAYAAAADRDQAGLLLDAFSGLVRRSGLEGQFELGQWKATCLRTGSVLTILAADGASAFGLRPDFVCVDEVSVWPETPGAKRLWEALTTSMVKVEGSRFTALSTAGDPAHFSRRLLDHALADPLWYVHEVPGPVPWNDPERLEEQRRQLTPSSFARFHMNQWVAGEDRLALPEDVAACTVLDGPQEPRSGRSYVAGVDVGLRRDRTAVAICHREGDDVILDRLAVWQGTRANEVKLSDIEQFLVEAHQQFHGLRFVIDPWQAVGLKQRLGDRGMNVTEFVFGQQSVGRIAMTLFGLVRDHRLRIYDDADLIDELVSVRLRESSPGVVRMDHDPGRHDDRAIALALAAQQLLSTEEEPVLLGHGFATANLSFNRPSPWAFKADWGHTGVPSN